jgi:tripeptide aminopeptidase
VIQGNRIVPKGQTGLGADNRTGVAALLVLARCLIQEAGHAPPVTLLFSVGEEVGLAGAAALSLSSLGNPRMGFNFDGGPPARIVVGAIGSDRLKITVHGRSAHAGMHPEDGISAGILAAKALAWLDENGWHGAIQKGRQTGTANVGTLCGGEATNQVMDQVSLRVETRSHQMAFLDRISRTWEQAFRRAVKQTSATGHSGRVEVEIQRQYLPFKLRVTEPAVQRAMKAAKAVGLHPETAVINGGLDANPLNAKGLPVVSLGAGQHGAHTLSEYVDIREYLKGCELACALCRER